MSEDDNNDGEMSVDDKINCEISADIDCSGKMKAAGYLDGCISDDDSDGNYNDDNENSCDVHLCGDISDDNDDSSFRNAASYDDDNIPLTQLSKK
jgi:hypothetical protein